MAEHSTIEWTDATWNPITGCAVVSPGCTNCYAMGLAGTRLKHHPSRVGLTVDTKAGPVWNGSVRLNEEWLTQPLQWKRPRRIFVCAHGDLFAEGVPDEWIDRVFAVMALAPHHTFQVLTKRAARMRAYIESRVRMLCGNIGGSAVEVMLEHTSTISGAVKTTYPLKASEARETVLARLREGPLPNVWLGVSAEDQRRADERVPDLLATPAAVRFVSAEPLLGSLDLWLYLDPQHQFRRRLDWVIVGGESGPNARPMHPDWARSIRDQCAAAGVAFHFKQWGAWLDEAQATRSGLAPCANMFDRYGQPKGDGWHPYEAADRNGGAMIRVGKKAAGRLLDGVEHNGMPEVRA